MADFAVPGYRRNIGTPGSTDRLARPKPLSVFDLFTVGIGPSSSHTVGPMRAAAAFTTELTELTGRLESVARVTVDLYGSLAATGAGHGTMNAVLVGLEGTLPDLVTPAELATASTRIEKDGAVLLGGVRPVPLRASDLALHPREVLARHSNGMTFAAFSDDGELIAASTYFSIGGGFIEREGSADSAAGSTPEAEEPLPFSTAVELLEHCARESIGFSEVMLRNELPRRSEAEVRAGILHIRDVMEECKNNALVRDGDLPGTLRVRRRAPA
ncbi:hypothetical protein BH11ACT2_BH11ACT2_05760 [soil metagenome]